MAQAALQKASPVRDIGQASLMEWQGRLLMAVSYRVPGIPAYIKDAREHPTVEDIEAAREFTRNLLAE